MKIWKNLELKLLIEIKNHLPQKSPFSIKTFQSKLKKKKIENLNWKFENLKKSWNEIVNSNKKITFLDGSSSRTVIGLIMNGLS